MISNNNKYELPDINLVTVKAKSDSNCMRAIMQHCN